MISIATRTDYENSLRPRRVSLKTFMEKYREGGKGCKYEWNNGFLEKYQTMKQVETLIYLNLMQYFVKTKAFGAKSILTEETEVWMSDVQMRKPDIAFWTYDQVKTGYLGINNIPLFVIEVISEYDQVNKLKKKIDEYFNAGVQVVWHIFPENKMVEIYTSPKNVVICTGSDICSAASVIPDMMFSVDDLFAF